MSSELFDVNNDEKTLYKLRPPTSSFQDLTPSIEDFIHESLIDRYLTEAASRPSPVKLVKYKRDPSPLVNTSSESLSDLSLNSSASSSSTSPHPGFWSKLKRRMRNNLTKFSFMFTFFLTWAGILLLYKSGYLSASETSYFKNIPALFADRAYEIPFQISQNPSLASAFILEHPTSSLDACYKNLVDIHDGSLTYLHHAIEFNQYVFIYLYSHWDARSIYFSSLIKELACKYSSEQDPILFLAVNCFNPNGECRKYFNLIKYPQVVFQIRNSGIFAYKGPMELSYVSEFVDHLRAPIKRIDSVDELVDFTVANQVVAVANLNVNNQPENDLYKTYYLSALKAFSQNSENPIKYGIVLNQTVWSEIKRQFQEPVLERLKDCNSESATPVPDETGLENKIMIFDLFGYKKTLKNGNKTTVDSLTAWAQNNFRRVLNWSFPDRDRISLKYKSSRPNLLVFTRKTSKSADKLEDLFKYLVLEDWLVNHKKWHSNDKACQFYSRVIEKLYESIQGHALKGDETLLVQEDGCWSAFNSVLLKYADTAQTCRKDPNAGYRPFNQSVQVDLLDLDLYLNYAKSLLHESKHSVIEDEPRALIKNGTESIVILVDYQHENLNWLQKAPTYRNLREFIAINKKHNLNNRHIRVKQVGNQSSQIEEINTVQLAAIFSRDTSPLYHDKDLLIFYFNNWCGFCKTASFVLNDLIFRYLKNCPSFKVVEIDTDSNDLPWDLHAQHLPALLFKPAKSRETTFFSYDQLFTLKELLHFILHNAGSAETLKCYLNENVVKPRLEEGHADSRTRLHSLVTEKVATLNHKISHYSRQLQEIERAGTKLDEYSNYTASRAFWTLRTQLYFHSKHLNLIEDFGSLFN